MGARSKTTSRAPRPAAKPSVRDHLGIALGYAQDVVKGRVKACLYVRQACKRQLDDLVRFKKHPVYYWDENQAGRICRFLETLPHVKGPKAVLVDGEPGKIVLEPWQIFDMSTLFGWRRRDTNARRFRRGYTEVPRGNAKSTLSSGLGLYCTGSDGEEGAEVYSAATTRDQAKIVFGDAAQMLRRRLGYAGRLGLVPSDHRIKHPLTNSRFEPLSRESKSQEGRNIHLAIVDELHAHPTREVYDVIETGAGKRPNSLIWVITTAGSDTSGICYEVRSYVVKVLAGVVEDDSQFGIIYTVDDGDDWTDPEIWKKANPNWGVSVDPAYYSQLATKAMQVASAQNNFKTKHLNIWCNADVAWMDMSAWDRCADLELDEHDFRDVPGVQGLDLATKTDISSDARVYKKYQTKRQPGCDVHTDEDRAWDVYDCPKCYPPGGETEPHFYLFLDNYLPEARVHDMLNAQYPGWALEGWLTETPGDVLDFGVIKESVVKRNAEALIREVAYDPWQSAQLAQELQDQHGITMVEVRPTTVNFSAPMKEFEALVLARRIHHQGSPVMRWMISNVVCHTDAKDNIYPRKERPENKIDGVVASIMALSRALLLEEPYANRGFLTL